MIDSKKRYILRFFVYGLSIEVIVITILYHEELRKVLIKMVPALTPEYVAAIFGVVGVLIGALLTELYNRINQRKKRRRELISEYSELTNDFLSLIKKTERAYKSNDKKEVEANEYESYNLLSRVNNLNTKTFDVYSNIWIRTATNRLTESFKLIIDELFKDNSKIQKLHSVSENWIKGQIEYLYGLLMKGAGIDGSVGGHPVWVGFRKVNVQDKENLKFNITAPPWEPIVEVDFQEKLDEETKNEIIKRNLSKVEDLRCQEHGYAPHVVLGGKGLNKVDITVLGCCKEFAKAVEMKLMKK